MLSRLADNSLVRTKLDGSKEYFGLKVASSSNETWLLTAIADPWGNQVQLHYGVDPNFPYRLDYLLDLFGRKTRFKYNFSADPYRVTEVDDPFSRFATFAYNPASHQLTSITDTIGIQSQYTWLGGQLAGLQTPYGSTVFSSGSTASGGNYTEAKDADGLTERVQFEYTVPTTVVASHDTRAPTGVGNSYLEYRNTFYWTKKMFTLGAGDLTKAKIYHWCHGDSLSTVSGVLESVKNPLEARVWMNYLGQPQPNQVAKTTVCTMPEFVRQILPNGQQSSELYLPNIVGLPTTHVDAIGRTSVIDYAVNNIDVAQVSQQVVQGSSVVKLPLLKASSYVVDGLGNSRHRPQVVQDASGGLTSITYDNFGQISTIKNPLGEVTSYVHNPTGTLFRVLGPKSEILAEYTYDVIDRLKTLKNGVGEVQTYTWDDADRLKLIQCSDGTSEGWEYVQGQLEPSAHTDRGGHRSTYRYTPIHQIKSVTDAAQRTTGYDWCSCGSLAVMTDPRGFKTTWQRDLQGRVKAKVFADGTRTSLTYEPESGRLSTVTDAKGQVKTYAYNVDGTLSSMVYSHALVSTPTVKVYYDQQIRRPIKVLDGTGATTYQYVPLGASTLGAGELQQVTSTSGAAPITYTYDEVGRVKTRIVGAASDTFTYDDLGRPVGESNELGSFTYSYLKNSILPTSQTGGPVTISMTYQDLPQAVRLKSLTASAAGNTILNMSYGYTGSRIVSNWKGAYKEGGQQVDWSLGYDTSDRLTSWTELTAGTNTKLDQNTYGYDAGDNRVSSTDPTLDNSYQSANSVNELLALTSRTHASSSVASTTTMSYDSNGSLVSKVTTSASGNHSIACTWDAENRLASYFDGTTRTTFSYNAANLVSKITSIRNGGAPLVQAIDRDGMKLVAIREGATTKRFYNQGIREKSGALLYTVKDHLGSVRAVVDKAGAIQSQYQYDPYGGRTTIAGSYASDLGYAGYLNGPILLAPLRAYDPSTGRWLSRDPVAEAGGMNLYAYAYNSPSWIVDPLGLWGGGVYGAVSGTAGLVEGGAAQFSGGYGLFTSGGWGGFLSAGIFLGGPLESVSAPANLPCTKPFAAGLYAGGGLGGFFTNADSAGDLAGPFYTWELDTPLFGISLGFGKSTDGRPIWIGGLTVGPGGPIGGISGYTTNTFKTY